MDVWLYYMICYDMICMATYIVVVLVDARYASLVNLPQQAVASLPQSGYDIVLTDGTFMVIEYNR
jgi:hypothetical protein